MEYYRKRLKQANTIVIKVGTSTITYETGKINLSLLEKLAFVISDLRNRGKKVVLVTSGAIGVGVDKLGLNERPKVMSEKQAAAAIGQCELMHVYSKTFSEYGYVVGQILLTREEVDFEDRRNNIINTMNTLLKYNAIPVVNENDSISVEEIEFGDNDTLSAIVAKLIDAELLIILSDIDGLYNVDPKIDQNAKLISVVEDIDTIVEKSAGGAGTVRGTGGMFTKLAAAKIAMQSGIDMVVASGQEPHIILNIINGEDTGTLFVANKGHK